MPQAVVDEFEMIEIEVHDRQPALVAARLRESGRHAIAKQNAIRQIGEHVVMRAILELLLGHSPLRDIAIIEDDRADARLVQHVLRESFDPDPCPVLVHETELAVRSEERAMSRCAMRRSRSLRIVDGSGRPKISRARIPNVASACGFHSTTLPSRSTVTTASSADAIN